jgi:hypothetical protein
MNDEELKILISDLVKNSIQGELGKIRASRGYDGRTKPISKTRPPAIANRINTGLLYESVDVYFESDLADGDLNMVVDFGTANYWYWVNYGRRGKLQGAKYPPLDTIMQWATQRRIPQFRDDRGRFMSNLERGFLLQRSIGEYGIYKTEFVQKGMQQVLDNVVYYLGEYSREFIIKVLENKRVVLRTGELELQLNFQPE